MDPLAFILLALALAGLSLAAIFKLNRPSSQRARVYLIAGILASAMIAAAIEIARVRLLRILDFELTGSLIRSRGLGQSEVTPPTINFVFRSGMG